MPTNTPGITGAIALCAGMLVQVVVQHLNLPSILLLLAVGLLLGPEVVG